MTVLIQIHSFPYLTSMLNALAVKLCNLILSLLYYNYLTRIGRIPLAVVVVHDACMSLDPAVPPVMIQCGRGVDIPSEQIAFTLST